MARHRKDVELEHAAAQKEMQRLVNSEAWQTAKTAADVAGIVDPTPASDAVSMGMSLTEGDLIGAGLSGLSMIPWLGDAVAKPIKAVRAAKSIRKIKNATEAVAKKINGLSSKIAKNKEAARRVREARKKAVDGCQSCSPSWGTHLPNTGSFKGRRGNSKWTSESGKFEVPYKDGYPDFKKAKGPDIDGKPVYKGSVEIDMTESFGKHKRMSRDEMRKKTGNDHWPGKDADDPMRKKSQPEGYTWHHGEDGATMHLVRRDVHDRAESGAAHSGGASLTGSDEF